MIKTNGFPGRYIQGPKALTCLPGLLQELGLKKPVVMVEAVVAERILPGTMFLFAEHGFSAQKISFPGECTANVISKLTEEATFHSPDVIIALGGGKTIDAAVSKGRSNGAAFVDRNVYVKMRLFPPNQRPTKNTLPSPLIRAS